jgi:hypothetical protein
MSFVLGLDSELGYDVDGLEGGEAFVLADNIRDLSLNMEKATDDVSVRGGNGFRQMVATLRDGSVEFQMVYDTADAAFTAFHNAFFIKANEVIGLFVADGPLATVGTQGLKGDFMVTNFSITQNLEEANKVDVTCQLTYSAFVPIWFTVV